MATIRHRPVLPSDRFVFRYEDRLAANEMGFTSEEALQLSVKNSIQHYLVEVDDEVVCAWGFGAHSLLSDTAYGWLITASGLERYPTRAARASKRIVGYILELYRRCEVRVLKTHTVSRRWLTWLGFVELGEEGIFIVMEKVR